MEKVSGRRMQTPQDFDFLAAKILGKTQQRISVSTLKRLYGYVSAEGSLRRTTLDILCQYVGYQSWAAFCVQGEEGRESESNPLLANSLSADMLCEDDRVVVTWLPDRECVFRCTGPHRFVVEKSRGSKLREGDTFVCHLFIKGEPLYLESVVMQGAAPVNYVCGRESGVLFWFNGNAEET